MKKKSLKKLAILGLLNASLATTGTVFAGTKTVYSKGTPVYWESGRNAKVWSYSKVQSHVYQHSATANGVWSGWKNKGTLAVANTWTSPTTTATAYWSCR